MRHDDDRLIRLPQVRELVSLARSTIYKEINDGTFPPPVRLTKRARGWRLSEIKSWIDGRPSAR